MRGARGNEGHDFFSFFSLSQKFLFGPLTLTGMLIFTFGFLHLVVITVLFEKKKIIPLSIGIYWPRRNNDGETKTMHVMPGTPTSVP